MLNILNNLKSISKLLFQVLGLIGTDELVTTVLSSGDYDIDWSKGTLRITMTENTVFTESKLPTIGRASIIDIYLDGDFIPTFPASWDIIIGSYTGTKKNQVVVKYINATEYWVTITPDS